MFSTKKDINILMYEIYIVHIKDFEYLPYNKSDKYWDNFASIVWSAVHNLKCKKEIHLI